MTIKERQQLLAKLGFYKGPIDGINGPQTGAATIEFKASIGLAARDYVGPITIAALRNGVQPVPANILTEKGPNVAMPAWLRLAYSHLGLREIKGTKHNSKIVGWWEALALNFRDDETPWCAGFVNAMILQSGLPITPKYRAAALGWRWTGYGKKLDGPALGAVMSITRPGSAGSGHMTFVAGRDAMGRIMGLGGNQGDAVSINPYHATDRDAQYHWPEGAPPPDRVGLSTLPIISATGSVLTNEA